MRNKIAKAAVTAAFLSAACVPAAQAQSAEDLQALKAQLEALQKKVTELEAQQKAATEVQEKTLDQVAQQRANVGDWVGRFQWKGDFRYRNETIDQEFVHSTGIAIAFVRASVSSLASTTRCAWRCRPRLRRS